MKKILNYLRPTEIASLDPYVRLCYEAMISCKESNSYNHSGDDMIFERDFVISLAYNMGRHEAGKTTQNYLVGGEVNKSVFHHYFDKESENDEIISRTRTALDFQTQYVTPDFLIHKYKQIKEIKKGGQKLVIEAKTKSKLTVKEFNKDFFKLNVYLNRLCFEYAVYLLINQSVDSIDTFIAGYMEKDYYINKDVKGNLIFMIQEQESKNPQVFQFIR